MKKISITLSFLASIALVSVAIASTTTISIKFPVVELGSCKDAKDCHVYCEKSENILKCTAYGKNNGLISAEDAVKVQKFSEALKGGGPGKCIDQITCKLYCDENSHIDECLVFAEKHELVSVGQLKEAKIVAKTLQDIEKLPGGCKDQKTCEVYCSLEKNWTECSNFGKKTGLISEAALKQLDEALKETPPAVQTDIKCIISSVVEKMKSGGLKSQGDFMQLIIQNCLPKGTKIPPGAIEAFNPGSIMKMLSGMQGFYGKNLSPKDSESIKKLQEYYGKDLPSQATGTVSGQKTLNLDDIKNMQENMQKDLDEQYKKMTPEEREYLKKMQEQGQFENVVVPEASGGGHGMGM